MSILLDRRIKHVLCGADESGKWSARISLPDDSCVSAKEFSTCAEAWAWLTERYAANWVWETPMRLGQTARGPTD